MHDTDRLVPTSISIHAPREGSDEKNPDGTPIFSISIHAPREGSDAFGVPLTGDYFVFQSTLPAKGATLNDAARAREFAISIHAPREGSDDTARYRRECKVAISIHAPREGSDRGGHLRHGSAQISIHAPREGSDSRAVSLAMGRRPFQSTLPAKGAT